MWRLSTTVSLKSVYSFILEESEVSLRESTVIKEQKRIPLEIKDETEGHDAPSGEIFLSGIHSLASTGESGFSITLVIPGNPERSLSLDISLSRFIDFL